MDFELQNPDFVPFQYRRRPRAYLTKKKRLQLIIRGIIARKSLLMAEIDRPIEKKNENSRPYVCSACNSNQKTAYQFCEHMAIHHSDPNDRVWKCVYCSTSFGRRGGLRRHVQMVHMQMMHKCPIENCSHPGYKCTKALNAHVRTHTRPFTCDRCDAAFARKNDLQVHQFTHLL
ncbi:hypothetical protein B9Z55_006464 [Caenorhabditis nigoni]|uniref:C2H2-type domain-containing protein n=1 Tax=Caenorhabditis nigoni TaxID=1611254 RepID=A0A2G5V567_9PELO|nr:hypothetical protein B9Z55_006464 [Caenorhabditis nigoni]